MKLALYYKNICCTLDANTNVIEKEIRKKILTCQFFILYNNMQFYEYVCDTYIFNDETQINYTAGCICFISPYE